MKHPSGFTLVEMIVTITLTAFIGGSLALLLQAGVNNYFTARELTGLSTQTGLSLAKISYELRSADSISVANSQQITFATVYGDTVNYQLSGSNLQRTQNGSSAQLLSNNVKNLSFTYFSEALTSTATLGSIRVINVSLECEDGQNSVTLIASIAPRNLL